jgi:hypothetical protein
MGKPDRCYQPEAGLYCRPGYRPGPDRAALALRTGRDGIALTMPCLRDHAHQLAHTNTRKPLLSFWLFGLFLLRAPQPFCGWPHSSGATRNALPQRRFY